MASAAAKRVCIVVGLGGGGIGDHIAKKFASQGYRCALVARSDLTAMEAEIHDSKSYRCDTSNPEQIKSTVDAIVGDMGDKVDALMYNVGSGTFKTFEDLSVEELEKALKVGPLGLFAFVKSTLPYMGEGGSIGITGATASWRGMPFTPGFAPAKFATRALAQSLARDLGPSKGIHVFHVVIDGVVNKQGGDNSENKKLEPANIAETYWQLSQQPQTCWTQEVNVAPGGGYGSIATI